MTKFRIKVEVNLFCAVPGGSPLLLLIQLVEITVWSVETQREMHSMSIYLSPSTWLCKSNHFFLLDSREQYRYGTISKHIQVGNEQQEFHNCQLI